MNLDGIEQLNPALQRIFRSVAATAAERKRKAECIRTNTPYRAPIENFAGSPTVAHAAPVSATRIRQDEESPLLAQSAEEALNDRLVVYQRDATNTTSSEQLELDL